MYYWLTLPPIIYKSTNAYMSLGKELPKLIEKSQEQIDETIQAINASTLPEEVKSLT